MVEYHDLMNSLGQYVTNKKNKIKNVLTRDSLNNDLRSFVNEIRDTFFKRYSITAINALIAFQNQKIKLSDDSVRLFTSIKNGSVFKGIQITIKKTKITLSFSPDIATLDLGTLEIPKMPMVDETKEKLTKLLEEKVKTISDD